MPDLSSLRWRKSRRSSAGDNCVELAKLLRLTAVRDSKNPEAGALVFDASTWARFTAETKAGRYNLRP